MFPEYGYRIMKLFMNCSIPSCERVALIPINRPALGEPPMKLCQHCYYKLVRRVRTQIEQEQGDSDEMGLKWAKAEDHLHSLTNLEIEALLSGNEFKGIMAKILADAQNQSKKQTKG